MQRDCRAYFLKHGLANLSLRPLAAAIGTSARMLVHHFGSKEQLIATVLEQVRQEFQELFIRTDASPPHASPERMIVAFWRTITSRKNLPYVRLLFEVQILAIQNPGRYQRYLFETTATWLRVIQGKLPPGKQSIALATLYAAVIDGLLLEVLATGDLRRTSRALEIFAATD